MQVSRYRELEVPNLLCYHLTKNQLYSELHELNRRLNFIDYKTTGKIKFILQKENDCYKLMIPKENIKTNVVADSFMDLLRLDSAVRIRFEGKIMEYEANERSILEWLEQQFLSPIATYYCILQTDDDFDFMVFDVYIDAK